MRRSSAWSRSRSLAASPLFWPVAALVVLLVCDALVVPGFLSLRIQDGHLYGSLVDILKNGAPTALIALGMTLVIATRGIDLSVGATVAISAAVACSWIVASPDPASGGAAVAGVLVALGLSLVLGLWNGFLVSVLGIQFISIGLLGEMIVRAARDRQHGSIYRVREEVNAPAEN